MEKVNERAFLYMTEGHADVGSLGVFTSVKLDALGVIQRLERHGWDTRL